jgi:hypothetical protein
MSPAYYPTDLFGFLLYLTKPVDKDFIGSNTCV